MHLFAGVGGGILGDLILGHKPIVAVEWDRYACQVLRERAADGWFDGMQVWEGDVRLFDPSEYKGRVDCIHAGFPCQDISLAGKQAGVGEETRSGLYREVLRIADVVRPQYIFLENVSAILNNGLGTVLGDLASLGYDARWCCLRASDVGANHQRDRWWLLAKQRGLLSPAEHNRNGRWEQQSESVEEKDSKLANSDSIGHLHGEPKEQSAEARINALGNITSSCENVAYTNTAQCTRERKSCGLSEEHSRFRIVSKDVSNTYGITRFQTSKTTCSEREERNTRNDVSGSDRRPESRVDWWQSEPNVGRVVNGFSTRTHQLKGLGNAQVPLQAAVAFQMLMEMQ